MRLREISVIQDLNAYRHSPILFPYIPYPYNSMEIAISIWKWISILFSTKIHSKDLEGVIKALSYIINMQFHSVRIIKRIQHLPCEICGYIMVTVPHSIFFKPPTKQAKPRPGQEDNPSRWPMSPYLSTCITPKLYGGIILKHFFHAQIPNKFPW
jgi:hypothetical protein